MTPKCIMSKRLCHIDGCRDLVSFWSLDLIGLNKNKSKTDQWDRATGMRKTILVTIDMTKPLSKIDAYAKFQFYFLIQRMNLIE